MHGAGGSGTNEWYAFAIDGVEMNLTMAIDYGEASTNGYAILSNEEMDNGELTEVPVEEAAGGEKRFAWQRII